MTAKVIQVIETRTKEGEGIENNPYRTVRRYWSLDGEQLAEVDPCKVSLMQYEVQKPTQAQGFNPL